MAVALAAETTCARAAALLEARSAALQDEIARLGRAASTLGEVVASLGSLMNDGRPVILTDSAGRIVALSAGAPVLTPAAARTALARPAVWTSNGEQLLLALQLWTVHEPLDVLTLEQPNRPCRAW